MVMHTRPFDWRDLPQLHKYRNETLYLNSALLLTRGPLQTLGAMVSSVVPSLGVFTSVYEPEDAPGRPVIGQVLHDAGAAFAYLSFLAPAADLGTQPLPALIEHLLGQIAGRGVLRVLAELDEHSPAVEGLRRAGFAVYTRQRIWRLAQSGNGGRVPAGWRSANEADAFAARTLYASLVPGLVQQVENTSLESPKGLVYYREGELRAYVELRYGLMGIWARPYVHPDYEAATADLIRLLQNLPSRHIRPVYVAVSSYQSWLDGVLEDLGAKSSQRQVFMAKHLAMHKKLEPALALSGLEGQSERFALVKKAETR